LAQVKRPISITEKAARYFSQEWREASGKVNLAPTQFADELEALAPFFKNPNAQNLLGNTAKQLRGLE